MVQTANLFTKEGKRMWDDEFEFSKEWITSTDYELKVLMLIVILAENNLAYRGTLTTMCDWLNLTHHNNTYQRISEAIESLDRKQYVHHIQEGRIHTLSISNKGLKDKKSIKIRKAWIKTIRNYREEIPDSNISVDWSKIVKVFIYCCCDMREVRSNTNRATEMGISKDTFRRCLNVLKSLRFDGLQFNTRVVKHYDNESNHWATVGSEISVGIVFDETKDERKEKKINFVAIPYWPDPDEYDYESYFGTY